MRNGAAGFSLMEVMIAITIGMVVMGAATYSFTKAGYSGKKARATADLKAFEAAVRQYEMENGSVPTQEQGLQILIEGGYIDKREVPKDPWKEPYVYLVPGPNNLAFEVYSRGADKQEGGEGKNQDLKLSEIE